MPFDQSTISEVRVYFDGPDLLVAWRAAPPSPGGYQVYLAGQLSWSGTDTAVTLPAPPGGGNVAIDVGAVGVGEAGADFSASLPRPDPGNAAVLTWPGSTALGAGLAAFRLYRSTAPGGPVSFARPIATVTAFPAGVGGGGANYSYRDGPLANGLWSYAIRSVDSAGNEGATVVTATVPILSRPRPPRAGADGTRLAYSYDLATKTPTLTWQASPSF